MNGLAEEEKKSSNLKDGLCAWDRTDGLSGKTHRIIPLKSLGWRSYRIMERKGEKGE